MASTLMSPHDLLRRIDDPDTVVVDCRWYLDDPGGGRRMYEEDHIQGASYVSLDDHLSGHHGAGRHPLPSPEAFAATCVALGISDSTAVVAYDDKGGAIAARLWWMLMNQGHRHAYVLDGGLQAWVRAGGPINKSDPPQRMGAFIAREWSGTVERGTVASLSRSHLVIDARSHMRYVGSEEPVDPVAGHIPGAVSVPLTGNLNDDLTFLSADLLRHRFETVGIADAKHVISQCGSGVTACHNILAMVAAGMGTAQLYVGSWSDWSSSGLPVATGAAPG